MKTLLTTAPLLLKTIRTIVHKSLMISVSTIDTGTAAADNLFDFL